MDQSFALLPRHDGRICGFRDACAVFAPIAYAGREVAAIAYLDPQWRILGLRHRPATETRAIALPYRAIVADVLALDAAAVVLAHNHPSGDPTPSAADLTATRRLALVLEVLGVFLHDHLVMTPSAVTSLRDMGVL